MYFDQVAFGNRLKELRKKTGLSQEAMAEKLCCSKTHYGNLERGKKGASLDIVLEISELFHVSTDYLLIGRETVRDEKMEQLRSAIKTLCELEHKM